MKTHLFGTLGICLSLFMASTGCDHLKPGNATATTPGVIATVKQSENPADQTTQTVEETVTTEKPSMCDTSCVAKVTTSRKIHTTIGPAQKDAASEIKARLASFKAFQWFGVALILFGVVSAVYPPLKVITGGSITTSVAIGGAGVALLILPTLVVGHELFILTACGGGAAIWFFAHRHGQLRGRLDANHNGIDDQVDELIAKMRSAKDDAEIEKLIAEADKFPGGRPALEEAANTRRKQIHPN